MAQYCKTCHISNHNEVCYTNGHQIVNINGDKATVYPRHSNKLGIVELMDN